jgi:hypothetical protein
MLFEFHRIMQNPANDNQILSVYPIYEKMTRAMNNPILRSGALST